MTTTNQDIIDRDGTNATASFLLNDHHDVIDPETGLAVKNDSDEGIDYCAVCRRAVGWVQPTDLGPDEWGHSTQGTSDEILTWIDTESSTL